MPALTARRAVFVAGIVACVVYAGALANSWALDDYGVIERNPAAHSIGGAVAALFSPYWPPDPEGYSAGLYRPLVILSYALDWTMSGAAPWWFHLVNILLHGIATALAVSVALAWLPPVGALVAGLVFAVHPVHVEAVANVVGRAELLAAIGMLGAVLAARRCRLAGDARSRRTWLLVVLLCTSAALLSKEHAVMTVALLALDHWLFAKGSGGASLYIAVLWLTIAWLFLWRAVAGGLVESGAAIGLGGLTTGEQLATMIPVQLEVVRLLVWPARLAADYSPQTIPLRTEWTLVATVAAATSVALLMLAVAVRRRAPAVAFGILAGAATYLPTSNLFFLSGVVLGERNLYLAVLAPALALGWIVTEAVGRNGSAGRRRALQAAVLVGLVIAGAGARTAARVTFWKDSRTVVVQSALDQPENFRARTRLARAFELGGEPGRALAEYAAAGAIFERYSVGPAVAARLALQMGQARLALDLARRARSRNPDHAGILQVLVDALLANGSGDSAAAAARAVVERNPTNVDALSTYVGVLDRIGRPAWQRLLAAARLDWRHGRPARATARLDSAVTLVGWDGLGGEGCWELASSLELMRSLLSREVLATVEPQVEFKCR